MNRPFIAAMSAVVALVWAQWWFPVQADRAIQLRLMRWMAGPPPTVQVTAIPFWQMASGRFQSIAMRAHQVRVAGVSMQAIDVRWTDGQVALRRRSSYGLCVLRAGTIAGSVVVGSSALAALFNQTGFIESTRVNIAHRQLVVRGVVRLDGRRLPIDVSGRLMFTRGRGGRVVFYPRSVNGRALPGPMSMNLFIMSQWRLPLPLRIVGLRLGQNRITVRVVGG